MIGELHYGHEFYLSRVRASLKNPVVFYGQEDYDELVSYLGEARVDPGVVLWAQAESVPPKKTLAFPDDISPLTLHVLYSGDKLPGNFSSLSRILKITEYKTPRAFSKDYENFVREEAALYRLSFDDKHIPSILSFVGEDLFRLSAEIKKLSYMTPPGEVPLEVLKMSLSASGEVTFPSIGEAFLKRDPKSFFTLLVRYVHQTGSDGTLPLVSYLFKQCEKCLQAMSLSTQGLKVEEIGDRLGMNPWRYKNHFHNYLMRHSGDKLSKLLSNLVEVEYRVRTGTPFAHFLEISLIEALT